MNSPRFKWKRVSLGCAAACVLFAASRGARGDDLEFKTLLSFGRWRTIFVGSNASNDLPGFTGDGAPLEQPPQSLRGFHPTRLHGTPSGDRIIELLFIPPGSKTLKDADLADIGQCTELESLVLESPHLTDAACLPLLKLRRLKKLAIRGGAITDAGLKRLSNMDSLEVLELADSPITDSGLEVLRQLPRLRSLNISGTKITDRGLEVLSDFPALRELNIARTAITEDGLRWLPKRLDWLWVEEVPLSDVGCSHLSKLTELQVLVLTNTKLGDKSLSHLCKLHKLNDLTLGANPISGKGLKQLHGLRKLRLLGLAETNVTQKEADALHDAMPGLYLIMGIGEKRGRTEWIIRAALALDPEHTSTAMRLLGKRNAPTPRQSEKGTHAPTDARGVE